jgi:hypothetical protein
MIANWGNNTCILCGFLESNGTTTDEDTDADILVDLYPQRSPLLIANRQHILTQLNFGVGNLMRK